MISRYEYRLSRNPPDQWDTHHAPRGVHGSVEAHMLQGANSASAAVGKHIFQIKQRNFLTLFQSFRDNGDR